MLKLTEILILFNSSSSQPADIFSVKGNEYPENSGTSHLFQEGRRPDTAFQRYRNSKLGGEFHSEINGRSLSECLDECLRQVSFQCRSAVYSERFRICRLSRFNQRDGHRVIYDADYDYYENLMGIKTILWLRLSNIYQLLHNIKEYFVLLQLVVVVSHDQTIWEQIRSILGIQQDLPTFQ